MVDARTSRSLLISLAVVTSLAVVVSLGGSEPRSAHAADPPWLGVIIVDGGGGALIQEVVIGSPADASELRPGDVILAVGETRIRSAASLIRTVAALAVGADVDIKIKRSETIETVPVTLTARLSENEILGRRLLDRVLPPFDLPVLKGQGSGMSRDHRGDVAVYYFYDPFCKTCATLDAALSELAAEDGVRVIAVSTSANWGNAKTLSTELKSVPAGSTVVHDNRGVYRDTQIRTRSLPIVVAADRKGLVRYAALGKGIIVKDLRYAVSRAHRDDSF